jgi:HEAT repeat protein
MGVRFASIAAATMLICILACVVPLAFGDPLQESDRHWQLDPYAIVVMPLTIAEGVDSQYVQRAETVYEQLVAALAAIPNIHVVDPDRVAPFLDLDLLDFEVAEKLGAANLVKVELEQASHRVGLAVRFRIIEPGVGLGGGVDFGRDADVDSQLQEIARRIEQFLFPERRPDPREEAIAHRAVILDFDRSDEDRYEALWKLNMVSVLNPDGSPGSALSLYAEVALAAADLGLLSEDPEIRAGVWRTISDVRDPNLIGPLSHALRNDTYFGARVAAAIALNKFSDDAQVRENLQYAARNDPNQYVRERARWSLLSAEERWHEQRHEAMDESLSERDRWLAVGELFENKMPIDDELRISLVSFANSAKLPKTRLYTWFVLGNMCGPEIVDPMLVALAEEPDEVARQSVAGMLASVFIDEPGVRDALVSAQETDESRLVRKTIEKDLSEYSR